MKKVYKRPPYRGETLSQSCSTSERTAKTWEVASEKVLKRFDWRVGVRIYSLSMTNWNCKLSKRGEIFSTMIVRRAELMAEESTTKYLAFS